MNQPFPGSSPNPPENDTYTVDDPVVSALPPSPPTDPTPAPMPTADTKSTFSRLGLSVVLLTVGMIVAQIALSSLMVSLIPDIASMWWANWVISVVPLYGVGLPLMLLLLRKVPIAPHNRMLNTSGELTEKPAFGIGQWALLMVMGFGCMYIGSIVGNVLMEILSGVVGYDYGNQLESMVNSTPLWATFIVTCIIAPLGEEFLFRKLLIDRARRYGDATAILISGLLFGLFHGNLFQFFYAAMLGILLAYIYTRTNNLLWCVGMHAAANLMGGIIVPELSKFIPEDMEAIPTLPQLAVNLLLSLWIYGTMIAAIVLLIVRFKQRALSPDPHRRPTSRVLGEAILNPGMLILIALLLGLIVLNLIPPAPPVG